MTAFLRNRPRRPGSGLALLVLSLLMAACGSDSSSVAPPPPPVTPSLSIASASIAEGDSGDVALTFTVSLSAPANNDVSVTFNTADGSATSPADFASSSDTLTLTAGNTSGTIGIIVHGDTEDEADETFTVTLSSPVNATIATATAIGTIRDDDSSAIAGLDSRPDNQSCIAPPRPTADASVTVSSPFPALTFTQPTKILLEPVADPRLFVLQKTGQVMTFDPDNPAASSAYMDISPVRTNSEGGLLGMAFHPDYPNTSEVFLSYTIDHSNPGMRTVVSRLILDDVESPSARGAGTVEEVLLLVDQEQDNHNGGDIAFGADGFLYIGLGDGGGSGDPNNRAQDTSWLLGSMLRIDVTGPGVSFPAIPYVIPADNPFAGNAICGAGSNADDCPEIFAWGLRNPWRWSFDTDTGQLWLADVGQNAFEEIDLIELGGNYGWRCREGAHDFNTTGCGSQFIEPVSEYGRGLGSSVTGGAVYRGSAIPELEGKYIFADYGSGRIWALQSDGQGGYTNDQLIDTSFGPTSFAADENGELLFTDINSGRIRMLQPAGAPTADTIPDLLSATGCVDPADVTAPYDGLVPYDVNAAFWSDGANKERHFGIPNGGTITRVNDRNWEFPAGTIIVKNFRLNGALIETRHFMRHPDGEWAGYTYEWNAQQTEATRVRGGKTVSINGQDWIYPSESQCMECHTSSAGFTLGPETAQLNADFTYPATSRTANQLETLDHVGLFSSALTGPVASLPVMPVPGDGTAAADERARAYLHTNCAQCHRPNGPTPSTMDLRYTTSLTDTNACNATPLLGDLGINNALLISPGDAAASIVIERAARRDIHGMPPLGAKLTDTAGITVLTNWINSLTSCN